MNVDLSTGQTLNVNGGDVKITDTGDIYVKGVGGYDGTNAGQAGVKTIKEVIESIPVPQVNSDWNATEGVAEILNKPTIPAAQIQSDWSQSDNTKLDFIKNKPSLATVATSGSYNDLENKPNLATVATSGSYDDLTNKPEIPRNALIFTGTINHTNKTIVPDTVSVSQIINAMAEGRTVYYKQSDGAYYLVLNMDYTEGYIMHGSGQFYKVWDD